MLAMVAMCAKVGERLEREHFVSLCQIVQHEQNQLRSREPAQASAPGWSTLLLVDVELTVAEFGFVAEVAVGGPAFVARVAIDTVGLLDAGEC